MGFTAGQVMMVMLRNLVVIIAVCFMTTQMTAMDGEAPQPWSSQDQFIEKILHVGDKEYVSIIDSLNQLLDAWVEVSVGKHEPSISILHRGMVIVLDEALFDTLAVRYPESEQRIAQLKRLVLRKIEQRDRFFKNIEEAAKVGVAAAQKAFGAAQVQADAKEQNVERAKVVIACSFIGSFITKGYFDVRAADAETIRKAQELFEDISMTVAAAEKGSSPEAEKLLKEGIERGTSFIKKSKTYLTGQGTVRYGIGDVHIKPDSSATLHDYLAQKIREYQQKPSGNASLIVVYCSEIQNVLTKHVQATSHSIKLRFGWIRTTLELIAACVVIAGSLYVVDRLASTPAPKIDGV